MVSGYNYDAYDNDNDCTTDEARDEGEDLLLADDADDNCLAGASQPSEQSRGGGGGFNMCDDDNDQEKQAGQGGVGEKDVAFYCRCPQIVITRVAASLATPAVLTVVAIVVVAAAPSLSVPVTVVQEIQICKISRGRSVRWINGDMLREVSTDCAELGRRKKL